MAGTYIYDGRTFTISVSSYKDNGKLALTAIYDDGDMATFTVNLNHPLQSDTMVFLDTNIHPWLEEFIVQSRLGLSMGYHFGRGPFKYPLYTIRTSQLL